jgi:hypothetical protein
LNCYLKVAVQDLLAEVGNSAFFLPTLLPAHSLWDLFSPKLYLAVLSFFNFGKKVPKVKQGTQSPSGSFGEKNAESPTSASYLK